METIKVNLSTFEYQNKRIIYPILVVAALIVLIISAYNIQLTSRYQNEIFNYKDKIANIERKHITRRKIYEDKTSKISKQEMESIESSVAFINKLIEIDVFPWDRMLDSLERHVPSGIILLSFTPSEGADKVLLTGNAGSMKEITLFLKKLEDSEIYKKNILLNLSLQHKDILAEKDEKDLIIRFEIESTVNKDSLFVSQEKIEIS